MNSWVGRSLAATVVAASTLALAPWSVQAYPYNAGYACPKATMTFELASTHLAAVYAALADGRFTNKRDQDKLLLKVDEAWAKANVQKWPDARQKLQDIDDAVGALAAAAKPKLRDASAIEAAIADAQLCMTP